ncbi:frag1 dram sfk1 family protein [Colletotrichum karsti]|uniref:Frag1 dram sfk1 family protein n=1 Tax=Colletotrichum karsti TaxID=1095194 RepID=A0A9P6LQ76_9PEZI|nr:frag1 dram sfk1 family protein [Colletotrichum karsti]KAF9881311.1 frag1 dram sfk1 family protein [Colletotrichum karsti]
MHNILSLEEYLLEQGGGGTRHHSHLTVDRSIKSTAPPKHTVFGQTSNYSSTTAKMKILSYWVFPIISGLMWLSMLLGMLLYWIIDTNREVYPSMSPPQTIAYISDVGAYRLKPLFVTGCVITTIFLDLSFFSDRWLRHKGRLAPNTSTGEKILYGLSIFFAIIGTVGLICLSIFDTYRHKNLHLLFLLLFMAGYLLSACFICWEYQRLGIKYPEHRSLAASFWIKLVFILVELVLAIAFVTCNFRKMYNAAAILEWVVAFVFSFYVWSFMVDLYPAVRTRDKTARFSKPGMREWSSSSPPNF